jgi:hypothetical protein
MAHIAGLLLSATVALALSTDRPARPDTGEVEVEAPESVAQYGIFEVTLKHRASVADPFHDVIVDAVLTTPSGTPAHAPGFYYGDDVWKVRFRPDVAGRWTYRYRFSAKDGYHGDGTRNFTCTPSRSPGPVRQHADNPFRWVFANGEPFFPVGLQDCFPFPPPNGALRLIDGGQDPGSGRRVSLADYFAIYGQAGFNLFRISPDNCSYPLFADADRYRLPESLATDELLALARQNGLRVMFGFFGFYGNSPARAPDAPAGARPPQVPSDAASLRTQRRFIDYCVARWGAYVDFWELLNERDASDEWTAATAAYVRSVDPDHKPIATSWEKPNIAGIDVDAPHWYESEPELESDWRVHQRAAAWKAAGKPVIVGEQGNTGMNWDPRSATRMRVRTWTALFHDIALVFWNTSWSKAGMFGGHYTPGATANIYLGEEERGYIRALTAFSRRLDADARVVPVESSTPDVRVYGLRSAAVAAVYLHHVRDHKTDARDVHITLDLPAAATAEPLVAEWIEPATGAVRALVPVAPGRQTLAVPPFSVDLALLVDAPVGPHRYTTRVRGADARP